MHTGYIQEIIWPQLQETVYKPGFQLTITKFITIPYNTSQTIYKKDKRLKCQNHINEGSII